jgi:TfoX/Sxy family transcriptional regulator of competence genes
MATDRKTVDYIVKQIAGAGAVSARPMFSEYGLYCDGKMIGIIGDEQLFLKPTAGARALADEAREVPPYPGAKPYLLIDADRWEDRDWMTELSRITAAELPAPKPKPGQERLKSVWAPFQRWASRVRGRSAPSARRRQFGTTGVATTREAPRLRRHRGRWRAASDGQGRRPASDARASRP